jgi:hypothetical protein
MSRILSGVDAVILPPKIALQLRELIRRSSAWSQAKSVGKNFVPTGEAARACERLLAALRAAGLFVVDVGELEGFVRTQEGHGPKWVSGALRRNLAVDDELEAARRFVLQLVD